MIHVQRAGAVLDQHVVGQPLAQNGGGAGVAVVALAVRGRFLVQDESDDVVRAFVVQSLLQVGVDDVIGRSDHVAERTDAAQVVAVRAEGADVGHGGFLSRLGRDDEVVVWRAASACNAAAPQAAARSFGPSAGGEAGGAEAGTSRFSIARPSATPGASMAW